MKAIETVYKGYRFRSRLEARWAVFFDALDIAWTYEPEGFDLDGEWYLPDFWLPGFDLFVEIKPFDANKLHPYEQGEVMDTIRRFRDCGAGAIMLLRDPGVYGMLRCWDITDSSGGSYDSDFVTWSISNEKPVLFDHENKRDRSYLGNEVMDLSLDRVVSIATDHSDWWHDSIQKAYKAFKQARFEYGENGAPHAH